jgi:hypothetical protein
MPAPAHPVRDVGGGADPQCPVRAAAQPLCRVALDRDGRGGVGYGSALLGYHYYTWAFIGFAVAVVALAAMLLFDAQFKEDDKAQPVGGFVRAAVWLVLALTALNVISTLLECGFGACPDNPVTYELLKRAP